MRHRKMIFSVLCLLLVGLLLSGCVNPFADRSVDLSAYEKTIQEKIPEDLQLTIYYTSPHIFTNKPMSIEDLVKSSFTEKIVIGAEELSKHISLFQTLDASKLKPAQESYMDARLYYVLETEGKKILEVASSSLESNVFVNGVEVAADLVFYKIIRPFLTEDAYRLWGFRQVSKEDIAVYREPDWPEINLEPIPENAERVSSAQLQGVLSTDGPGVPVSIQELNEKLPIRYFRKIVQNGIPVSYVAYPLVEGGCAVVTFDYYVDLEGENGIHTISMIRYFDSQTLTRNGQVEQIIPHQSTIMDVFICFPAAESVLSDVSGLTTYALLDTERILKVEYDRDIYLKESLHVVESYEIISKEKAPCLMGALLKEDITFQ